MKTLMATLASLLTFGAIGAAQEQSQAPRPGKEHEMLKEAEGEWDVRAKFTSHEKEPGKSHEAQGTESNQMGLGGFWLMMDHRGQHDGKPFEGKGLLGYDPAKRKYVMVWADSTSPSLFRSEGTADPAGKVLTLTGEGVDPKTGKACKTRTVCESIDRDHRTMKFYKVDDAGKETLMGEIHYTRKAAQK